MIKNTELVISPDSINDEKALYTAASQKLKISTNDITAIRQIRRSIDARSKFPVYRINADIYVNEPVKETDEFNINYKNVSESAKKAAVIGFGPAGMFAALRLLEAGVKPVVFERGKDVRARRFDLKNIQQEGIVNPDSNYCFGEGGAGTYSDGKLYTRSDKRGNVKKILNTLVNFGAVTDILLDAHPHIGSNKLPQIVQSIREKILECGGEIYFENRVTDLLLQNSKVKGLVANGKEHLFDAVILATGHSARDVFYMLKNKSLALEAKPFAMGVRIEHPQALIDKIQYHSEHRNENLPAASYNVNCRVGDKGVFSFCMCPGGIIVPASTAPDELVLNGMSVSKRNSKFANSGFVVEVNEKDWQRFSSYNEFAGLMLQKELEEICFRLGNNSQKAPAQRITDFVNKKISSTLPETSYIPGTISVPLHSELPSYISEKLSQAMLIIGKQKPGFYTENAQILACESRTSSPVRIPRNKENLMHIQAEGLYPAGEGAGYAGGIVSAAIDGENCAAACIGNLG